MAAGSSLGIHRGGTIGCSPSTTGVPPVDEELIASEPLRAEASASGLRVGAAVSADLLRHDVAYRTALAGHFNSLTPENAMKWTVTRPGPDEWNWTDADLLVDFADAQSMEIRGHTLTRGSAAGNGVSQWLRELDANLYLERLGPGYIGDVFRAAHAAPARADGLVALVTELVEDGVPIDGVGFQTHLTVDVPTPAGAFSSVMQRIRDLGLEVAVTELDVPMGRNRNEQA